MPVRRLRAPAAGGVGVVFGVVPKTIQSLGLIVCSQLSNVLYAELVCVGDGFQPLLSLSVSHVTCCDPILAWLQG